MAQPKRTRSRVACAVAVVAIALRDAACGGPSLPKPIDLETMRSVPAGEFIMGRDGAAKDEEPQRRVWLDAFYIDRTEVTNRQYKAFCDATRYLYPNNPYWDLQYLLGKPDYPALNLTWEQARAYCAWARKRLPTEAEWEKAARGTDGRTYPWGNTWADSLANMRDGDGFEFAAPVGSFPAGASPYGALDMAGNVWEWCADWYQIEYYSRAPSRNPLGPQAWSPYRVLRGGSFTSAPSDAEVANRDGVAPTQMLHHAGCRCAWSSQPPGARR